MTQILIIVLGLFMFAQIWLLHRRIDALVELLDRFLNEKEAKK